MIFVLLYHFSRNVLYLLMLKILFHRFGACTSDCQEFRVIFLNFLASSMKTATKKQPVMEWTDDHDILLHCVKGLLANCFSSRKAVQTVAKSGSQSRKD